MLTVTINIFLFDATIGRGLRQDVIEYEAPRSMGTRMIVLTLFKPNEPLNFVLIPRENFSTRDFAEANALGPPVAAAFLKIKKVYKATDFVEVNALGQPVGPASFKIRNEEGDHPESVVDD